MKKLNLIPLFCSLLGMTLSAQWYADVVSQSEPVTAQKVSVSELQKRYSGDATLRRSMLPELHPNSLDAELKRLASLEEVTLDTKSDASLPTVIRTLADSAEMRYFNIPYSISSEIIVNGSLRGNPYRILRELAHMYGFEMRYDRGIWTFGYVDQSVQIVRNYRLSHYSHDRLAYGYGPQIVDVLNPDQKNPNASNSIVAALESILSGNSDVRVWYDEHPHFRPFAVGRPTLQQAGPPQIVFDGDSRSLIVRGSYSQQELVSEVLKAVDQPLDLIEVEIKFLEIEIDPSRSFGLDWSGTLEDGYGASISNLRSDPGSWSFPNTILSADDLQVRLRAFANDRTSRMVAYPRTVTLSNREVVFDAIREIPFVADREIRSDAVRQEIQGKEFLEVGTRVRVNPVSREDGSIFVNLQIEVSEVEGFVELGGSLVPQPARRRFTQTVTLEDNYTLATGGLETSITREIERKIPLLGDVPYFGFLFKNRSEREIKSNLLMFLTVRKVDHRGGGIGDTPRHIVRSEGYVAPRREFEGTPSETVMELFASLDGLSREVDIVEQSFREGRNRDEDLRQLRLLRNEMRLMGLRLEELIIFDEITEGQTEEVAETLKRQLIRLERIGA